MVATEHLMKRISQRGITSKLLSLVSEFGKQKQAKIILDKKTSLKIIYELDQIKKDLLKIIDKGGVVLVVDDNVMITAYNKNN